MRVLLCLDRTGLLRAGVPGGGVLQRLGEPGREICAAAQAEQIDHAPCPLLLLRGKP
jgi:hypothetical protein